MNFNKLSVSSVLLNDSLFRYFYILSIFMSSLCFVEPWFQIATGICMVWGMFLIINYIQKKQTIKNIFCIKLISLFLASTFITLLVRYKDNLYENLYLLMHIIVYLILLYGMHSSTDKHKIQKEMYHLFRIFAILTMILSFAGLCIMIKFIRIKAYSYIIGLNGIRFTGLYTHPNIAAFVSVVGIICCHMLYNKTSLEQPDKLMLPRWICILSAILNFITILLSDSNNSLLFLIVYSLSLILYKTFIKRPHSYILTVLKIALLYLVMSQSVFALRGMVQSATSDLLQQTTTITTTDNPSTTVELGRTERTDVTSGRIDSLKKAIQLYKEHPIIGIGKENIVDYGSFYLSEGFNYFDLHNGYLTLLVSTGFVGFVLFMAFFISVIYFLSKILFHENSLSANDNKQLLYLCAALCAYSIFALFERALLFDTTFMVAIFWIFSGYAMTIASKPATPKNTNSLSNPCTPKPFVL